MRKVINCVRRLRGEKTRGFFIQLNEMSNAVKMTTLTPRVVNTAEASPAKLVSKAA